MILPFEQQPLGRPPIPAIRIGELLHQIGRTQRTDVGLQMPLTPRMVGNDAIDAPHRVAVVEIDFLADLFGDRFRRLDDLPVDIRDVQIAVRRIGEVAGPEPDIGGGKKLHVLLRAVRQNVAPSGLMMSR